MSVPFWCSLHLNIYSYSMQSLVLRNNMSCLSRFMSLLIRISSVRRFICFGPYWLRMLSVYTSRTCGLSRAFQMLFFLPQRRSTAFISHFANMTGFQTSECQPLHNIHCRVQKHVCGSSRVVIIKPKVCRCLTHVSRWLFGDVLTPLKDSPLT